MLKRLSVICCLLFFLPFLQTCSDDLMNSLPLSNVEHLDESGNQTEAFSKRKAEVTMTGFQLAIVAITPFTLILGITFLSVYFSFVGYSKTLTVITILNILLNLIYLSWLYFAGIIENVDQIKYGYYLFLIVLLVQLFYSIKKVKELKNKKPM